MTLLSSAPAPPLAQDLAERYVPQGVIGYGAYALVIKALDRRTGRTVAIKHFQTRGDNGLKKYFNELKVILCLRHPHIVQCLDLSATGEATSDLVFEYADAGSLRDRLVPQVPVALHTALPILSQVACGLQYAHENGIIHRDLKPENVLLFSVGPREVCKITDFGIARFVGPMARAQTSIGSPAYMAPEQFYDEYGLASDIYAFGILMYELLHGDVPFVGSPAQLFRGHLEGTPAVADDIHPSTARLLLSLLEKKPENRPNAAQLLAGIGELAGELSIKLPTVDDTASLLEDSDGSGTFAAGRIFGDMFGAAPDPTARQVAKKLSEGIRRREDSPAPSQADAGTMPVNKLSASHFEMVVGSDSTPTTEAPTEEADGNGALESASQTEALGETDRGDSVDDSDSAAATDETAADEGNLESSSEIVVLGIVDDSRLPNLTSPPALATADTARLPAVEPNAAPASGSSFFGDFGSDARKVTVPETASTPVPPPLPAAVAADDAEDDTKSAASFFGGGFEGADPFDSRAIQPGARRARPLAVGSMRLEKLWSRAVHTATKRIINLDDGCDLLLVTDTEISQLSSRGGRSTPLLTGNVTFVGTASCGLLPVLDGTTVRVLSSAGLLPRTWEIEDTIEQLVLSPDQKTIAVVAEGMLSVHDTEGNTLWTGSFGTTAAGCIASYDMDGRLMVMLMNSEDQSARYFSRTGQEVANHWLPGRVTGAARCRSTPGLWATVQRRRGPGLVRVGFEGVGAGVGITPVLTKLVGGGGWVAGEDEQGQLYVVDPVTAASATVPVAGRVLDFDQGVDSHHLYVLEVRDELLHYVTAYAITGSEVA